MVKRRLYPTCAVVVGGQEYRVHLCITPGRAAAHAGADSPRFMDPGCPPRVRVIRILRDGIEQTGEDLLYFTRRAIEEAAVQEATAGRCFGAGERDKRSPEGAATRTVQAPAPSLFSLGGTTERW